MKYLNKLVILFFFSINISFSQKNAGEIIYKKTFNKNFSELNQKLKKQNLQRFIEYNEIWNTGAELLKNIDFILKFHANQSLFSVNSYVEPDINELDLYFALGVYGSSIYYNNLMMNVYYRQAEAYGETFLIEMPKINWRLTDVTKIINGYTCFKAEAKTTTKGRNGDIERPVIAWYSKDIPVSFGPIGFAGLPGLIIKLIYDNEVYTVSKINFSSENRIIIKKPKKGIKVTKKEFEKIGLDKMGNYKKMF